MAIKRTGDVFSVPAGISGPEYMVITYGDVLPQGTAVVDEPLVAYVNHGRWIVDCPICRSAQVGDPSDPRFYCVTCGNDDSGMWLPVNYPDVEFMEQLSAVLEAPPAEHNRNWVPTETIEDVQAAIDAGMGNVPVNNEVTPPIDPATGEPFAAVEVVE